MIKYAEFRGYFMSFEQIIISPEQLKKEIKKHTNARMEKDYERSVKELDNLFKKTTLFFASTQLEEYKKTMIEQLKIEYKRIEDESKNKTTVETKIKSHLEHLGHKLKEILIHNKEINISNGHSFTSKNLYILYNSTDLLTIRVMDNNSEIFATITFKSKTPNTLFDSNEFKLEFNKKDTKGLGDVIDSNKAYFKEILQNLNLENLGKMVLYFYSFASKNESQIFYHPLKDYFQNKNFSNAQVFYSELINFKEEIFLTKDIKFNFD